MTQSIKKTGGAVTHLPRCEVCDLVLPRGCVQIHPACEARWRESADFARVHPGERPRFASLVAALDPSCAARLLNEYDAATDPRTVIALVGRAACQNDLWKKCGRDVTILLYIFQTAAFLKEGAL